MVSRQHRENYPRLAPEAWRPGDVLAKTLNPMVPPATAHRARDAMSPANGVHRVAKYNCTFYNISYLSESFFLKESCSTQALISSCRRGFVFVKLHSCGSRGYLQLLTHCTSWFYNGTWFAWGLARTCPRQPCLPTLQRLLCEGGYMSPVTCRLRSGDLQR
jgi:hypothetical protein